jgi:hypothetical protein
MIRLAAAALVLVFLAAPASADPFWRNSPSTEGSGALLAPSIPIPDGSCEPAIWVGQWDTEYGPLEVISVEGDKVEGTYQYLNGAIEGTLDKSGCVLTGRWSQDPSHSKPEDVGSFKFVFDKKDGSWSGTWTFDADPSFVGFWNGTRHAGIRT